MNTNNIHDVLQNIDTFKAKDIFHQHTCAGVGSRSEEIGVYLAEKVYALFDNSSTQTKINILRDLIKQYVDADGFEYDGSQLQNLEFDALNATEAYYTSNFEEYADADDFCGDFEVNLYLHDYLLNN